MKANVLLGAAALTALLCACASKPLPAPAAPPPPVVHHPRPTPPAPLPSSVSPPSSDWRDAPRTPGNWSWRREDARSVARYGTQFALACDPASRTVSIELAVAASPNQPVTVTTTSTRRVLSGVSHGSLFVIALPASDPLLDAMVFSRGRFRVETAGLAPFSLPSWTEISRVTEDCR